MWTPRPIDRAWGQFAQEEGVKPAAGAAWKWTVPSTYLYRVVSLAVPLTTSAQVAERFVGVNLQDMRGRVYWESVTSVATVAAKTTRVTVAMNVAGENSSASNPLVLGLPEVLLPPEWVVEGKTVGLQTEDQFGAPQILVEAFEPQPIHPIAEIEREAHAIRLLEMAVDLAATS